MTTPSLLVETQYIKQLLELSPHGAYLSDLKGNCLYVNKELQKIYGCGVKDILGTKWHEVIYDDDLPLIKSTLLRSLSTHVGSSGLIYRIKHPRKGIRYCKVDSKFIFDENNQPLYYTGYITDITSEIHKTENIKLQNELLSTVKNIQDQFYLSNNPENLFQVLLGEVLRITKSEFGFITEIVYDGLRNSNDFKHLASSGLEWNNLNVDSNGGKLDFTDISGHFKKLLKNTRSYSSIDSHRLNDSGEKIKSYIVLPAKIQGELVGMVGLANRNDGYGAAKLDFLNPLLSTFANLIAFYRLNKEKEQAVDKQRDLMNHLQILITSLEDIIFEFDGNKTFRHVWVSDENILFMPKENFIGKTVSEVFGPLAAMFTIPIDKAIETGEIVEFEYKHIDNSLDKWYKAKITTVKSDTNPINSRLVMSVQDITIRTKQDIALKEAKDRLERSNFLLDVTQELTKAAGWEYYLKTNEVFLTKQSFTLYDLDENFKPNPENTLAFFETDGRNAIDAHALKAITKRVPYKLELPITTAKNNKKWVRTIGVPIIIENEVVGIRGAALDITEEKEAEISLIKLKEQLERNIKDKDRIMQVLAHDLRSPLSAIHTMAAMILEKKEISGGTAEMLTLMRDSSLSAHNLVSELIDAMINNTKEDLKIAEEDIVLLIRNCVKVQSLRANEKKQKIDFVNETPIHVFVDGQKIERVINNLIYNAIKFSPKDSIITIETNANREYLQISIKDNGIGIPIELQNKVFDVLTPVKRYGTAGEPPFGIGLSICKQIIESHRGEITFKSEFNKGTTFFIKLPLLT